MGTPLCRARRLPAALAFVFVAVLVAGNTGCGEPPRGAGVRGGTPSGVALRAPVAAEGEEFSFLVYGDRTAGKQAGLRVLERAVTLSNRLDPSFVMTVGDLVQGYNREAEWLEQMREFKEIMSGLEMPWYPAAGNHDVYPPKSGGEGNTELYKEHFGPLYYSFDYKWAHFVVLFADEKLSFSIPSLHQNMSEEQMAWLREDLAATDARQVFVFLHHPRWTYQGTNWKAAHRILADDGRVQAVIAGHLHEYRYDGVRDGIHLYTLAVTGGNRTQLRDTASFHHLNRVIVRPDGFEMSVFPVEPDDPRLPVLPGDFALGSEVDAMNALFAEPWLDIEGAALVDPVEERRSELAVTVRNATNRRLSYELSTTPGSRWQIDPARLEGEVAAGETSRQRVRVKTPGLGERASLPPRAGALLRYPLQSGLVEAIPSSLELPVSIPALARLAGARPDRNQALVLDGSSAVRVNLTRALSELESFTLEAWARGTDSKARQAIASNTRGSSFGIFWRALGAAKPAGLASFNLLGYTQVGGLDVPSGRWTHLALVHDGEVLRFFVDGSLAGKAYTPGIAGRNELPFFVGAEPSSLSTPRSLFTGAVDELRLSNVARYTAPFTPAHHHERDAQTVLLLHFDVESRGLFPDDSGREHHGWAVGEPALKFEKR